MFGAPIAAGEADARRVREGRQFFQDDRRCAMCAAIDRFVGNRAAMLQIFEEFFAIKPVSGAVRSSGCRLEFNRFCRGG